MGFWDAAGSIAKAGLEKAKDFTDDVKMYKDRFENDSDDELQRIYKNSSGAKKVAAHAILRERGYNLRD